jgi:excinuclease ABC subunit B
MYADKITPSMAAAIDETNRRRDKQLAYNKANGIDPTPLRKKIADITDMLAREDADTTDMLAGTSMGKRAGKERRSPVPSLGVDAVEEARKTGGMAAGDLAQLVQELTDQMRTAAADLQFEVAARLRDEISDLKRELRQMVEANR